MSDSTSTTTELSTTSPDSTEQNSGEAELLQLVSFVVGEEEFAVSILYVQEINRMMPITRVPQSPDFVEGVINLRGKIIPVVNLRKRFGLQGIEQSDDSRIMVVEITSGDGVTRVIGYTVDKVNEVLRISSDIVEPPPPMVASINCDYVQGVGKLDDRLLILLDLEKVFNEQELKQVDLATASAAA